MKEDFLHYLWRYTKFAHTDLKTSNGEPVTIINTGQYHQRSGPDFFNAQLVIAGQKWAGNIEIHLKSSDWYHHRHETDSTYENVILHVVWEHDTPVFRKDNSEIPVLELKNYVRLDTLSNYRALIKAKSWIFCEKQLSGIDPFLLRNWQERLFFERLESKFRPIGQLLKESNGDWEAVLFYLIAKNFGLNTNGQAFMRMAQSIPFSVVRKECRDNTALEGMFFGAAGLLAEEKQDQYFRDLKSRYHYLSVKYRFDHCCQEPLQFFKHRPDNFPTIRLSQLAGLYHVHSDLFSKVIDAECTADLYPVFRIATSDYWQTHYHFDKKSTYRKRFLSRSFIDLVIINTIVPVQFAYARHCGKENIETLIRLLGNILPESNAVTGKFSSFGIKAANACESQSLLQLKNEYCDRGKCMECAIGIQLLKKTNAFN